MSRDTSKILRVGVFAGIAGWLLACSTLAQAGEGKRIRFDIPAQSLSTALLRFSEQARLQVTMSSQLVSDLQTAGVRGEYGTAQALQQMLQGSGLYFEFISEKAVAIRAGKAGEKNSARLLAGQMRLAVNNGDTVANPSLPIRP